jgi:hypothetical protein
MHKSGMYETRWSVTLPESEYGSRIVSKHHTSGLPASQHKASPLLLLVPTLVLLRRQFKRVASMPSRRRRE